VRRNGYGRQRESFEPTFACATSTGYVPGRVHPRAQGRAHGCAVEVLAEHEGVRSSGDRVASSSLPSSELANDLRLHELFIRGGVMSGHSKWHSIKHKKGAADAARGKLFAVLIRQIEVRRQGGW
jgi:hypothetical protein